MHTVILIYKKKEILGFTFVAFFQGLKWRTRLFQQVTVYLFSVPSLQNCSLGKIVGQIMLKYAIKLVSRACTGYHYINEIKDCII